MIIYVRGLEADHRLQDVGYLRVFDGLKLRVLVCVRVLYLKNISPSLLNMTVYSNRLLLPWRSLLEDCTG